MITNKIFKYGELECVFDMSDYVHAERWENAIDEFNNVKESFSKESRASAQIKRMVLAIASIFDTIFGDGASNKVLGDSTSLDDAVLALNALQEFTSNQTTDTVDRWSNITSKYTPNKKIMQ